MPAQPLLISCASDCALVSCAHYLNPGAGDVECSSKAANRQASLADGGASILGIGSGGAGCNPRVTFDGKVRDSEPPRDK